MNKFNSDGVVIVSQLGGGGGGITNINVSAGTTSQNLSNLVFSNSNKLSFGLNGSTITAIVSGINAFGASNIGNTAGNTRVTTGIDFVIAGSNNITLNQSTAAGGPDTIWISGGAGGGGITNINVSAGTTSLNLSALTFSNINGISFGLDNSTITASHNGLTSQSTDFNAITLGGNTAGTTTFHATNTRTIFLNGGANITLSGNGGTITIIGAAGGGGLTNINVSAGTTSLNLSALTFSNINGVSFGLDNSTITASIATSLTNIRVSAGTTSNLLSALTFSNSNGISFGIDASTITASHNGLTSQSTQFLAITLGGNTAGTTTFHATNNATIFMNGGANITLSGNGSTITIIGEAGGGGGAPQLSYWNNIGNSHQTRQPGNATMYVFPLISGRLFEGEMTVNTMLFNVTGTVSTAAGFTRSFSVGFYTLVNSTQLSLAFSASQSWGTGAGNMNINDSVAGWRWVTFHSSQWNNTPAFSQTQYWMAIHMRSSGGSQSFSFQVNNELQSTVARSGTMSTGSVNSSSFKYLPLYGYFATSFSTAMPDTLAASNMGHTADNFLLGVPEVQFNNIGATIV